MTHLLPIAFRGLMGILAFGGISSPLFLPAIPGLILAALGVLVLLWAPYRVWQEENRRANKAEARLKPCITVEGDVVNQDGKTALVRVTNSGAEKIRNCTGLLRSIFEEIDGRLEPVPKATVYLQWTARHGGIGKMALDFPREAELDVAAFPSVYSGTFTLVAFDDRLRPQYCLSERSTYVFEIEIAADNSAAVCHSYQMTINPPGQWARQDNYGQLIAQPLPDVAFRSIGECARQRLVEASDV